MCVWSDWHEAVMHAANLVARGRLASTGSPIPSVVIGSTILDGLSTISKGYDLAFDASGNLWLVNFAAKTIVKWNAADLSVSGTPTPSVQIKNDTSGGGSTLSSVNGLAFDSSGNLWVANSSSFANANRVSKYNVSSLSGSSVVTPPVILTFATGTVPINLAFDNSGALWVYVTTDTVRSLLKLTNPSALTSGVPAPQVTLTGGPNRSVARFAFSPAPTNLPLVQQK